jgi:F-type H+-transporting ATPase subunit epsilon
MSTFTLVAQDASGTQTFSGVASFVGEDASGSFGVMAGHARLITTLVMGLARFRIGDGPWRYLALPGGVLYFAANTLTLATRRILLGDDYTQISAALERQLLAEEEALRGIKSSLHRMEEEILRRIWEADRQRG